MPNPFYRDAALYDLVHADGTRDDVLRLEALARRHGNAGRLALEPACGTGRYLEGLLRRGWSVCGYDLSAEMLAFARKRLARWGKRALLSRGDMTSFRSARKYDLAYNLLSTFRHLATEKDAAAHLQATHDALNPGGLYVLGLDLAVYDEDLPDEEVWIARRGGKPITHVMMTLPPAPGGRRERVLNFITVPGPRGEKVLKYSYDLRTYDSVELAALLEGSPFTIAACYDYAGKPAALGGPERSLWIVLRKD